MDANVLQLALFAAVVAMVLTLYELRASLAPATCRECPHCRQLAAEKQRRDEELQRWYARENGLDPDDDEDRPRR
jgi:hypothetical protein